jgi:hypothetical protein
MLFCAGAGTTRVILADLYEAWSLGPFRRIVTCPSTGRGPIYHEENQQH